MLAGVSAEAMAAEKSGTFRFLFPGIEGVPHDETTNEKLALLGEAMLESDSKDPKNNSTLPPILTYIGQFIDHDITAGTDSDPDGASIFDPDFEPLDRKDAVKKTVNMRNARLELDSLYGDGVVNTSFDMKLAAGLRSHLRGKMRISRPEIVNDPNGNPAFVEPPDRAPTDGANDLLRLGELIMRGTFTENELRTSPDIPDDVRRLFFFVEHDESLGELNPHRAMIGDARNDENLFVAQVHLAMLRFHNKVVDACNDPQAIDGGDKTLFEWARKRVRWFYQWLVVHDYLGGLCNADVLTNVLCDGAPLYSAFLAAEGNAGEKAPVPFEFSAGAFRFGHSMVRQSYDWNPFFPDAGFDLMFRFTGGVRRPMSGFTKARLPSNWPAQWKRLSEYDAAFPDRSARRIDTNLSFELTQLPAGANEPEKPEEPPKTPEEDWRRRVRGNLAARNLLKGHLNNLPHAQALIDAITGSTNYRITPLTDAELTSGHTGQALKDTGFVSTTPLWFYVLKEAEVQEGGNRLGQLGSVLVADTLLGLVINDPESYWHQPGSDDGRWHPSDTVKVGSGHGITVDSIPQMLRAALLL